jgi:hypothetical protein
MAIGRGLMEAGAVDREGFAAWPCSPTEALTRIVDEWLSRADALLTPGGIVWLNNTPAGTVLGEAILARERA